jgi:hypothetical protein
MMRSVALVGFLGVQAGVFVFGPSLLAADEPKDPPPFLKVMEDNFSGKKNVHRLIKRALDSDSTDWADVSTHMKQYATAAQHIIQHAKTKPEKGDDKSWAKLTAEFGVHAKNLEDAVTKKDKEKAKGAIEKLHETCEACHENHR